MHLQSCFSLLLLLKLLCSALLASGNKTLVDSFWSVLEMHVVSVWLS